VGIVVADEADAEPYTSISGETHIIKTSGSEDYTILYSDDELAEDAKLTYTAKLNDSKGNAQTSGVSPASGDLENDAGAVLTVSAPSTAGKYTLEVTFICTVGEDKTETVKTYDITVVKPITLSQTLTVKGDSLVDPTGLGVFFYIDGEKMTDSYKVFQMNTQGTATVSYDWVADPDNGKHTFMVLPAGGEDTSNVKGLGEEHTFYVGDNSYAGLIALAIAVVILMIILVIWIYSKPVKNYGKPKARR
jgi:hypothetical protein